RHQRQIPVRVGRDFGSARGRRLEGSVNGSGQFLAFSGGAGAGTSVAATRQFADLFVNSSLRPDLVVIGSIQFSSSTPFCQTGLSLFLSRPKRRRQLGTAPLSISLSAVFGSASGERI